MKRNLSRHILMVMTMLLIVTVFQWRTPLQARAAEDDRTATQTEETLQSQNTEQQAAQDVAQQDSCSLKYFRDLYENGMFRTDNSNITIDDTSVESGILVSGKNTLLSMEKIELGTYDFGSDLLQRIQLNALGEKGKKTKVMIYVDDQETAVGTYVIPAQAEEDNWSKVKNVSVDVSNLNLTGTHAFRITFCQYSQAGSVKTGGTAKVLFRGIQFVKQTLPVVNINIDESMGTIDAMNNDTDHNTECYGDINIFVPETYKNKYGDYSGGTYEMEYIRGRGNTTWEREKKPYKIKLDNKADLFGMGADKNWALIANAMDESLICNAVTYSMGEDLGMTFTPQGVFVDVVMNNRYLGTYYLCENIRVDEQRVDIDSESDFLLGAGTWGADEDAYIFTTEIGTTFNVTSPEASSDNYSGKCAEIEAYMQRVENALLRRKNPDTGTVEDPFDLIDLDSAVSYYWMQELSANDDFFGTSSTYCYRKGDGKLCWGPLWDFDTAWVFDEEDEESTTGWRSQLDGWMKLMLSFPEFTDAMEAYWNDTLYREIQSVCSDGGMIDQYIAELSYAAANNFSNVDYTDGDTYKTTALGEAAFTDNALKLKRNILKRAKWFNENLDSAAVPNVSVTFKSEGKVYAKRIAYGGQYFSSFPKNPVCSDKSKVFGGWYFTLDLGDGIKMTDRFLQQWSPAIDCCTEKNGKYSLTLNAKFIDKTADNSAQKVYFEKSTYCIDLKQASVNGFIIPYMITPEDGYEGDMTWYEGNQNIITAAPMSYGYKIYPKRTGTTKLTATMKSGKKYSVTIKIVDVSASADLYDYQVSSFKLNSSSKNLAYGSIGRISLTNIKPANYIDQGDANGKEFVWYSTSSGTVSVHAGILNAKKVGTATIICRNAVLDKVRYCKVNVLPKKAVIAKLTASLAKKKLTVKMKTKASSTGGSCYQIAYRVRGTAKWTYKTTTKQTLTLSNLKSGKTYQVRVRAYKKVDGKIYYGGWSTAKSVKIKK